MSGIFGNKPSQVAFNSNVKSVGTNTAYTTLALPAISGKALTDFRRLTDKAGTRSLDTGVSSTGAWLQSRDKNNYATNYPLLLQPNGGGVIVGSNATVSETLRVYGGAVLVSDGATVSPSVWINTDGAGRTFYLGPAVGGGAIDDFSLYDETANKVRFSSRANSFTINSQLQVYSDENNWFTIGANSVANSYGTLRVGNTTNTLALIGSDGGAALGGGSGNTFVLRAVAGDMRLHVDSGAIYSNANFETTGYLAGSKLNIGGVGSYTGNFYNSATANSQAIVNITSGNTGISSLFFSDTDTAGQGRILYDHTNDSVNIFVNSLNRFILTTSSLDVYTDLNVSASSVTVGLNSAGKGGNTKYKNDSGTINWLVGIKETASAIDFSISNLITGMDILSISSTTGLTSVGNGLRIIGAAQLSTINTQTFSYEYPTVRFYVGDGTGYSFSFSKRVASITTDLVTISDTGRTIINSNDFNLGIAASGSETYYLRNHSGGLFSIHRNNLGDILTLTQTGKARFRDGVMAMSGSLDADYAFDTIQDTNSNLVGIRVRNNSNLTNAYASLVVNTYGNSWGFRTGSFAANNNSLEIVWDALGTPIKALTIGTDRSVSFESGVGGYIHNNGVGRLYFRPGVAIGSTQFAGLYGNAITYNVKLDNGVWKSLGSGTATAITTDEGNFSICRSQGLAGPNLDIVWDTVFDITEVGGKILDQLIFHSPADSNFRGISFNRTGIATSYGSIKMMLTSGEVRYVSGFSGWGGFHTWYANGTEGLRLIDGAFMVGRTTNPKNARLSVQGDLALHNSNTITIAKYSGNSGIGASNTWVNAVDLSTLLASGYFYGLIKCIGAENAYVNTSFCVYTINYSSETGWLINSVTRIDQGNDYGRMFLSISGNYLRVQNGPAAGGAGTYGISIESYGF